MFYFCNLKKLVRPETFGPYYAYFRSYNILLCSSFLPYCLQGTAHVHTYLFDQFYVKQWLKPSSTLGQFCNTRVRIRQTPTAGHHLSYTQTNNKRSDPTHYPSPSSKAGLQNRTEVNSKGKGKAIPLQAWAGPEGSRRLRLPDFKTICT